MASLIRDGVVDSQWHRWHRPRVRALFPHEAAAAVPALPGARGHPGYVLLEWSLTLFVRYLPLDVSKQASTPTDSLTLSLFFLSLSLSPPSFIAFHAHLLACMHACKHAYIFLTSQFLRTHLTRSNSSLLYRTNSCTDRCIKRFACGSGTRTCCSARRSSSAPL